MTLRNVAKGHASDLDTLSHQLQRAIVTLDRAANSVERTAQRVDSASTSDDARRLIENVTVAAAELRHTATQLRTLSTRLQATEDNVDAFLASGDSVLKKIDRGQGTLGLLVNDPTMYRRTDSVLVELRALIADLRANPKKYISVCLF